MLAGDYQFIRVFHPVATINIYVILLVKNEFNQLK